MKVSQLQSPWGRNRDDYDQTNREGREGKTNIGNMAMNGTLLELGLSCPAGTAGTAVTSEVNEWSPAPEQLFIKADRLGGDRMGGRHIW